MNINFALEHQLCFQIAKTHQLYTRFYERPLGKFNLTYVQYTVLLALWEKDHVTVHQLSKKIGLNNGTLTPLLKRLQRAGWIKRTPDHKDRRKVIVDLTPKSRKNKHAILSETNSCLANLHYSAQDYKKTMTLVKNIQYRLEHAIKALQS